MIKISKYILKVRKSLKDKATPEYKKSAQRFFKSEVKVHGTNSSDVTKIVNTIYEEIKLLPKNDIFEICEELYKSGYEEEAWVAAGIAYRLRKSFVPNDFKTFERWIKNYIDDWAKCDGFCNHTVGYFIETFPKYMSNLKKWSKSKNIWLKRASAVSLILPTREGKFLDDVFEISDTLLMDQNDMVQKGYGWLLKETCKKNEKLVFDYIMKHKKYMPRTALRYAIEKMPEKMKKQAMEK